MSSDTSPSELFTSHAANLLEKMVEFRHSGALTDVNLLVDGCTFEAHRLVLAAASPYFAAMFASGMTEAGQMKVEMEGVDYVAMEMLLNYVYTAEVVLDESTVQSVLSAARMLQMDVIVEQCSRFIADCVNAENCLGIFRFADLHSCVSLAKTAWTYAVEHFDNVSNGEEFLTLDYETLSKLLAEDSLNSDGEERVFHAAFDWLQYDKESRIALTADLLQHVRLLRLSWAFLVEHILTNDLIAGRDDCQSVIEEIKVYHFTKQTKSHQIQPRNSFSSNKCIYVVGGEARPSRAVLNTVSTFKPDTRAWKSVCPMTVCRRGAGIAILGNVLYVVGGSDGQQASSSVEIYNPEKDTWCSCPPMNEARSSVACGIVRGEMYAVGGHDGHSQCLSSVEKYNPKTETWTIVSPMTSQRSMLGVAVIDEILYAIGGYDGSTDIRVCEKYDGDCNCWIPIASMQSCRCLAAVAAQCQTIIAAGGTNQSQLLDSVEFYITKTDSWVFMTSLRQCRIGASLVAFEDDLYILGGQDEVGTVDMFDKKEKKWVVVASMESSRRRFGCCGMT